MKKHMRYLRGRNKTPLHPPTYPTREDTIFAALRRFVPKTQAREARKNEWISVATWRLVNDRVSARRDPEKYQTLIRRLGHAKKASMTTDRRERAEEEGAEVEALVWGGPPFTPGGMAPYKGVV